MAGVWGRLVCVGEGEKDADRLITLARAKVSIGRQDSCQIKYSDDKHISSVHCTCAHAPVSHVCVCARA